MIREKSEKTAAERTAFDAQEYKGFGNATTRSANAAGCLAGRRSRGGDASTGAGAIAESEKNVRARLARIELLRFRKRAEERPGDACARR